jgi:hypothetical protein
MAGVRNPTAAFALFVAWSVVGSVGTSASMAQREVDPVTRARQAYNEQRFDEAVTLASAARQTPALANSASLVLARALLERFRRAGDVADVATARQALLSIDPARLVAHETSELHLGTAELLFVDAEYGAAAELFEVALDRAAFVPADQRDHVLEWWAASLDRHAQLVPETERHARYRRLLTRVEQEAARGPASAVVAYWLAAAARGVDDPDRAWSLVVAGWIQAPLISLGASGAARATALRADLDRLMVDAIIPERARRAAPPSDPVALKVALAAEWAAIKERWRK